jgi:hypothetical protein
VPEPLSEQIVRLAGDAADLYYRLLLVVAPAGSGKTAALRAVAARPGFRYVNLNLELSRGLLQVAERDRGAAVPRLLEDIVAQDGARVVLLDNIEILFDTTLKVDPLRALQRVSRNHTIVAAWNGALEKGRLVYAEPGHAEYRQYPAQELLVIASGDSPESSACGAEGASDEVQ